MHESNEGELQNQLMGVWSTLYDKVMQLTTMQADVGYIEHWFHRLLTRWADGELRMLNELKDLAQPKQKVADAFATLLAARKLAARSARGDPDRCIFCGELLTQGCFNDRGCLKCALPVTVALNDLICASTDRFTPESLHQTWSIFK